MYKEFKRVGTHSGRFHADEVMATAVLKEIFELEVVRSRDSAVLDKLDLVYDVGGGEFDHHDVQKVYRDSGTPYAACGLIWKRFGREVVTSRDSSLTQEEVDFLHNHVDYVLIEGIDAVDNGLRTGETFIPTMSISSIVSAFNPSWDSQVSEYEAFAQAVDVASTVLGNMLNHQLSANRAKARIADAFMHRTRPEVLVLDRFYPWMQALQELDKEGEVLFIVYPRDGDYLIQTIRKNDGTFQDRKKLPSLWAGKREGELGEIVGIQDAVFCHPARFIAGARSFDSIMKMVDIALAEPEAEPEAVPDAEVMHGFLAGLRKFLTKRYIIRR
jgi:uncharacterized UPF0160 family protein